MTSSQRHAEFPFCKTPLSCKTLQLYKSVLPRSRCNDRVSVKSHLRGEYDARPTFPRLARNSKARQQSATIRALSLLVLEALGFPGDVVVCVHDAADDVADELGTTVRSHGHGISLMCGLDLPRGGR